MSRGRTGSTSTSRAGTPDPRRATTTPDPGPGAPVSLYRTTREPPYSSAGCQCQTYGKSAVPYPSGKCIVCGYRIDPDGMITGV